MTVAAPTHRVEVSRGAHQLRVLRVADRAVVVTSLVGIGSPVNSDACWPVLRPGLCPDGTMDHPYGPFAFGRSGHSDVLMHLGTGDGRIAIHGTNQPSSIGADPSNGCVHVPNDVDLALIPPLSLGTPVVIS